MRKKKRRTNSEDAAPAIEDPTSDAESFGPWLRRQREGRGIDLREIADESKISVRYLEALEANSFEALPAAIFTKGFLRQYASYVGLDAEEVVNYYLAADAAIREKTQEDLPDELRIEKRPARHLGPLFVLTVLLLVALLLAVVWWLTEQNRQETDLTSRTQASASTSPRSVPPPRVGEAESPGAPAQETSVPATELPSDPEAEPPAIDPSGGEVSAAELSSNEAAVDTAPRPAVSSQLPASDAPVSVIVDFTGDCWVEASVDGESRIAEMRVQGESLVLEGESSIELKVGNIHVVRLEVNGQPWQDDSTSSSSVRQLRFDRETLAPPDPSASQ